jgi:hypothetical protein
LCEENIGTLYTFGTAMEKRIQSEPPFEHELVRRQPQLVKSTCERCGAFQLGSYHDGSLDTWEREHDCGKTVPRLTLLRRLRSWLAM